MITGPAEVNLTVHGQPAPQGSKMARPIYKGKGADRQFTGKVAQVESSKSGVDAWRGDVKDAARAFLDRTAGLPLDGPLAVSMVFTFARPDSHFGTGRNAGVVKPSAPPWPAVMPDLSKLVRSTEDALTAAGVWRDDSRVVQYRTLAKTYPGGHPLALPVPGARIWVWRLSIVDGAR